MSPATQYKSLGHSGSHKYVPSNSVYVFNVGNKYLKFVDIYKYLGMILNGFLEFEVTVSTLADATNRGLGPVIGKTMHLIDLGFKTFGKLFTTSVVPIMHYGSEV